MRDVSVYMSSCGSCDAVMRFVLFVCVARGGSCGSGFRVAVLRATKEGRRGCGEWASHACLLQGYKTVRLAALTRRPCAEEQTTKALFTQQIKQTPHLNSMPVRPVRALSRSLILCPPRFAPPRIPISSPWAAKPVPAHRHEYLAYKDRRPSCLPVQANVCALSGLSVMRAGGAVSGAAGAGGV